MKATINTNLIPNGAVLSFDEEVRSIGYNPEQIYSFHDVDAVHAMDQALTMIERIEQAYNVEMDMYCD